MSEPATFLFLTTEHRIIPGLAVLTNGAADFVNDAYVTIEDDGYDAKIIDVQNWDKQRFRYVHHEYEALKPSDTPGRFYLTTTCDLYDVDATGGGSCDRRNRTEQVNINSIHHTERNSLVVTGVLGPLYIFIHHLDRNEIEVYLRLPGSLEAKLIINARVILQELTPDNQLLKLRSEYGYSTASRDVKQSIIRAALRNLQDQEAIAGAISLCHTEKATSTVCRTLPIQDKARMCLSGGNLDNSRACDRTPPIITRGDFDRWIPRQLEVNETDELQLSHDFYPQSYKTPDEGYAEAFYKARLINTVCALIRPDVLTSYADILPPVPAYLDLNLIKDVVDTYLSINTQLIDKVIGENYGKYKAPYGIKIVIPGAYLETKVSFGFTFESFEEDLSNPTVTGFECRIESRPHKAENLMVVELMLEAIETSRFIGEQPLIIESSALRGDPEDVGSAYLYISNDEDDSRVVASYAFLVSKILKTLFDYGFLEGKAGGGAFTIEAGPVLTNIYNTPYIADLLRK